MWQKLSMNTQTKQTADRRYVCMDTYPSALPVVFCLAQRQISCVCCSILPSVPHTQVSGDRQEQEQVWLQVAFTHFWWLLSASELACCSHSLMWVCVLCYKVCRNLFADFSGDALVCSRVLRGSGIALTSLKREFQSIFKVLSGAFSCLTFSISAATQHASIFGTFGYFFNANLAKMRASQGYL